MSGRQICLLDHTELFDGAVWESVTDPRVRCLGELVWVVTVRAHPAATIAAEVGVADQARFFAAAGWQVLTVGHGRTLSALFDRPGGQALRQRLDGTDSVEFQELLRSRGTELRRRLAGPGVSGAGITRLLDELSDDEISAALRDVGGNDLPLLVDAFDEIDPRRPTVLFVYVDEEPAGRTNETGGTGTTDGTGKTDRTAVTGGPGSTDERAALHPGSAAARLALRVRRRLAPDPVERTEPPQVPAELERSYLGRVCTLAAFGTVMRDLADDRPQVAAGIVTATTPDAATVLAGWRDAAGTWSASRTRSSGEAHRRTGRHLAEPVSPGVLAGLLGGLGRTWNRLGRPLLPIGVSSDAAAGRVLPQWCAEPIGDAQSVLVVVTDPGRPAGTANPAGASNTVGTAGPTSPPVPATPAGPEPAGGSERPQPRMICWEPAFAQDLAWCALDAIGRLGRPGGRSALLRVSARPIEQALAGIPSDAEGRSRRRAGVLAGGYRLRDGEAGNGPGGGPGPAVTLVGVGSVVADVLAAADKLTAGLGRGVGVVCLTSPDLLWRALQARRGLLPGDVTILDELFPADRRSPLVAATDGDPRALGFLAGVHGDPISTLGAGMVVPVDVATIVGAALDLLDEIESDRG